MTVHGQAAITAFARKHAAARKPLGRFLAITQSAEWKHFLDVKQSFPAADYVPATGTLIFDIGGNKYRLIALVNFELQTILVRRVLTHEEYDRESL